MATLLRQTTIETRLFLRRKGELFWTLAFPVMFMVLFGLIYGDSKWPGMDIRSVDYLMPGIIVMAAMMTGIMRTSIEFIGDREKGIYRRLALTPLKRQTLIASQLIQHYVVIVLQTVLLMTIAVSAFHVNIGGNQALFWLVLTFGALCFMSIGFALTSFTKTVRSAQPINQIVYFVLMFLGGLFFPNSMLPQALGRAASILPSTQVSDAMRTVLYQGAGFGDIWKYLLVLTAWAAVFLVISIKSFKWE